MLFLVSFWSYVILVLCIAYFTLLERQILATVQRRAGPDYMHFGLTQPLIDGVKLLLNSFITHYRVWDGIFFVSILLLLNFTVVGWTILGYDSFYDLLGFDYSIFLFLICSSVSVYTILLTGLSSNSRYALLGSFRFLLQLIGYEINFSVFILCVLLYTLGMNFSSGVIIFKMHFIALFYFLLFLYLCILGMIESSRVPFDLPESESELVSGYNVEYGSFMFAILFLGEYGSILVFAGFISFFCFSSFYGFYKVLLISFIGFILLSPRALYPRLRYYSVLMITWLHLIWIGFFFFLIIWIMCL
jgi:NADH:ubiquinone oxidoreductase subunit H